MNSNDAYKPNELAAHRLEISNAKNDDNEKLTFPESKGNSSHGYAANKVRARADDLHIEKLRKSDDISEFTEMLKEF